MSCTIHPDELNVVPCSRCSREICKKCAQELPIPICSHCTEEIIKQNNKELKTETSASLNGVHSPENSSLGNVNTNSSFASLKKVFKNSSFLYIFLVLFSAILFGGLIWNYVSYLNEIEEMSDSNNITDMEKRNKGIDELFQRVRLLKLDDVRQFVVPSYENNKFEKLTVIEGYVVNGFDDSRSFIELEATLYDADGNILDEKTQFAGPKITFFQLQVLGELELEEALHNNDEIRIHNTNIKSKQRVPFTFIFYNPPKTAANFNVKIINAQVPEITH